MPISAVGRFFLHIQNGTNRNRMNPVQKRRKPAEKKAAG